MRDFAKSFSSPIRVKIMHCLLSGPKNVSDLIGDCDLSQSAVSQHLKKLRDIGVIRFSNSGRERVYTLTNKKFGLIAGMILEFIPCQICSGRTKKAVIKDK